MKKIIFVLAVLFTASSVLFASGQSSMGAAAGTRAIPNYINLDGYFPVVKQGTDISMTVSWLPDQSFCKYSDPSHSSSA